MSVRGGKGRGVPQSLVPGPFPGDGRGKEEGVLESLVPGPVSGEGVSEPGQGYPSLRTGDATNKIRRRGYAPCVFTQEDFLVLASIVWLKGM